MGKNNQSKRQKRNFTLKVYGAQGIQRYETSSLRRFLNQTRTINWQNGVKKVYVRISYGKFIDQSGRLTNFHNDGEYDNYQDFELAVGAFLEE